jgi:hypothetical protein
VIDNPQRDNTAPAWLKVAGFTIGVIAVLVLWFCKSHPQQLSRSGSDWIHFAMGVALTLFASSDIKSGVTGLVGPTFKRSEDPLGYWVFISVMAIVAAGVTVGTLGAILGLWQF